MSITINAKTTVTEAHIEVIVDYMERTGIPLHYDVWQNALCGVDGPFRFISREHVYRLIRLAAMQDKIVRVRPGVYMAKGGRL